MDDPLDYDWMPEALDIAAQCWHEEDTKHIEMDSRLAMVVAKTIASWMRAGAIHASNSDYWRARAKAAEALLNARPGDGDATLPGFPELLSVEATHQRIAG